MSRLAASVYGVTHSSCVIRNFCCTTIPYNTSRNADTHTMFGLSREKNTKEHQVRLLHDIQGHGPADLGQVANLRQAESLARRATGRTRLQFKPHPWLSPLLPLWGSAARVSREALRQIISASTLERARAHLERRRQRALQTTPAFQEALDAVDWSDGHLLEHSSSRQRLLFYRIKGHFLSGWDNTNHRRGCPHCVTAGSDGGTTIHIVWQCLLAQNLWLQLRSWWQRLGLFTESSASSNDSFFRAIFSLELPQTPPRAWDLATLHQCPSSTTDIAADPYPVLQAVWQQLALETMVLIHSWRNANDEGASQRSSQQARALHEANCTRILRTIATRYSANPKVPPQAAELVWELLSVFQREGGPVQVTVPLQSPSTLIFFAGGADATAGSGRAGAAIAQVDSRTGGVELLWQAAIPIASTRPTHLHASYAGLLAAHKTATQLGLQGPTVIGDNALILRQLHRHRPPRNPALRHLYFQARRIADLLSIRSWRHQYKAHNQLVNSLAAETQSPEHASTSSSSDACVNSSTTLRLLHSDTRTWLATTTAGHT